MSDTNIGMLAGLNAYNRDGSEDQQQHQQPEGAPARRGGACTGGMGGWIGPSYSWGVNLRAYLK